MVIQGGLQKILVKGGFRFSGSLVEYQNCPLCGSIAFDYIDRRKTLRIFPTLDGDFLFRCHCCGETLDSLELLVRLANRPPAEVSTWMREQGITDQIHSQVELEHYEWAQRLLKYFDSGHAGYEYAVQAGYTRRRFGEWGCSNTMMSPSFFPPGVTLTRRQDSNYLARLLRDVFGRAVRVEAWSENGLPLGSFTYRRTPVTFSMSNSVAFHDLAELIVCDSETIAEAIEKVVNAWPKAERIPVALPVDLDSFPIASNLPYPRVWFITRQDDLGELGLLLYRRGLTEVKTCRIARSHDDPMPSLDGMTREQLCHESLPGCMDDVVTRVVYGSQETMAARLSTVMSRRYISGETKRELLGRCATGAGTTTDSLINQLQADANPHALLIKGCLFVCRNGHYFKRDQKERWSEISNFSVRSIGKTVTPRGDATHELLLSVDGLTTTFSATDALLDSPPRLWRAARRAAALAALPELIMPNAQYRSLLPSLIKSTAILTPGTFVGPSQRPGGHRCSEI